MAVRLRGNKWHYRFNLDKAQYTGVCKGAELYATKKEQREAANAFEARKRAEVYSRKRKDGSDAPRIELKGASGKAIALGGTICNHRVKQNTSKWNDFTSFMASKFPEVVFMDEVTPEHVESYRDYILGNGRFLKTAEFQKKRGTKTVKGRLVYDVRMRPSTAKGYLLFLSLVFKRLRRQAGLTSNPCDEVKVSIRRTDIIERDAFSEDELKLILESNDPICLPLFRIGCVTGLREGDLANMEWSSIDRARRVIDLCTSKTGTRVVIPISAETLSILDSLKNDTEYVFPAQRRLYHAGRLSEKIMQFLKQIGIRNEIKKDGFVTRSTKDFHSLRHTFCAYAERAGIPLSVVQSIVGHSSSSMTMKYTSHSTVDIARRSMEKLTDYMGIESAPVTPVKNDSKTKMMDWLKTATPEEVEKILSAIREK